MKGIKVLLTTVAFAGVGGILWRTVFNKVGPSGQISIPFQADQLNFQTQLDWTDKPREICNDQLDNDGDRQVDCYDSDCASNTICEACVYMTQYDADTVRLAQGKLQSVCYCGDAIVQKQEQCESDADCPSDLSCSRCQCVTQEKQQWDVLVSMKSSSQPVKNNDTIVYKVQIKNQSDLPIDTLSVVDDIAGYFEVLTTTPKRNTKKDSMIQRDILSLNPWESRIIEIILKVNANADVAFGDTLINCVSAVAYDTQSCRRIPFVGGQPEAN